MVKSMTGAAVLSCTVKLGDEAQTLQASWDIRSVNGRNLDLRLRLPDGLDGLEAGLRSRLAARVRRGHVSLSLRLVRPDDAAQLAVDPAGLAAALRAVARVQAAAEEAGVALRAPTAAEVLSLRGVLVTGGQAGPVEPLVAALLVQAETLIGCFDRMRAAEGKALAKVLSLRVDEVEALLAEARAAMAERREDQGTALTSALERIRIAAPQADPGRLEQELALVAVRGDVTEELDRLGAHCAAARQLLAQGGSEGRRLDFLMQEFNREANTLCSKAQHLGLGRIGLDLKAVIDQMREQVQNLE